MSRPGGNHRPPPPPSNQPNWKSGSRDVTTTAGYSRPPSARLVARYSRRCVSTGGGHQPAAERAEAANGPTYCSEQFSLFRSSCSPGTTWPAPAPLHRRRPPPPSSAPPTWTQVDLQPVHFLIATLVEPSHVQCNFFIAFHIKLLRVSLQHLLNMRRLLHFPENVLLAYTLFSINKIHIFWTKNYSTYSKYNEMNGQM